MSIANELSCDVAAAMLAQREGAVDADPQGLTDILLQVHITLRQLTNEARQKRRDALIAPASLSTPTGIVIRQSLMVSASRRAVGLALPASCTQSSIASGLSFVPPPLR